MLGNLGVLAVCFGGMVGRNEWELIGSSLCRGDLGYARL